MFQHVASMCDLPALTDGADEIIKESVGEQRFR